MPHGATPRVTTGIPHGGEAMAERPIERIRQRTTETSARIVGGTMSHRLVTRSDFDGLVCAVLLQHLDLIDDILFVHPKDMQDGKVDITARDITTNLPWVDGVHLCFDHHESETIRNEAHDNHIIVASAPSAARVVWDPRIRWLNTTEKE